MELKKVCKVNRRNATKLYDSDILMFKMWKTLVQDFRSAHGDTQYAKGASDALDASIANFRVYKFPARFQAPPYVFKTEYQLENLFKRYKFKKDMYTDDELEERTNQAFLSLQRDLAEPKKGPSTLLFTVLQKARILIKRALGPFDEEELKQKCRFGKRACKGTPAKNAYLDSKLENLTGSHEHIRWFQNDYLPTDSILRAVIGSAPNGANYTVCDSLDMTNVPKSWKIKRGICPNTAVGSFRTYGLGAMIQDRLVSAFGINITSCQNRHRRLARDYSVTRSHVTADLSNASNCFTFELLCRLLPRDWLFAIKDGRLRYTRLNIGDSLETVNTVSYMMMGIGYTFTLQTLLFYALIKAVQQLLSDQKGTVSVYGDDLIYPRRIHKYVSHVLVSAGFQLNQDKTFVTSFFRESCGGDYYRGRDVRPFQPEGSYKLYKPKSYVLLVYQMINGLLERWDSCEIPQTLRFLYSEILRVDKIILQVPPHFPDYSGVRVSCLQSEFWLPWVQPEREPYTFSWKFLCYKQRPHDRPVLSEYTYYWEKMRSGQNPDIAHPYESLEDRPRILRFIQASPQPKSYRSGVTGKRIKKLLAVCARKGAQQIERNWSPGNEHVGDVSRLSIQIEGKLRGYTSVRLWRNGRTTVSRDPVADWSPLV